MLKWKSFRLISYKWRQLRIKINPVGDKLRLWCHTINELQPNEHLFQIFLTVLNINNFRLIEKQAALISKQKHVFWQERQNKTYELWMRLTDTIMHTQCTVHTHSHIVYIASHVLHRMLKTINNNNKNEKTHRKITSSNNEMLKNERLSFVNEQFSGLKINKSRCLRVILRTLYWVRWIEVICFVRHEYVCLCVCVRAWNKSYVNNIFNA